MAAILIECSTWFRVPDVINVHLKGKPQNNPVLSLRAYAMPTHPMFPIFQAPSLGGKHCIQMVILQRSTDSKYQLHLRVFGG